jgi:hypothetical protein
MMGLISAILAGLKPPAGTTIPQTAAESNAADAVSVVSGGATGYRRAEIGAEIAILGRDNRWKPCPQ